MNKINKPDAEWQKQLTPQQFQVTRKKGTEPAFSGQYHNCHQPGVYLCVCCENELFNSKAKFDSGSGWPSFWEPLKSDKVETEADLSHGMKRIEVHCSKCNAHLGHVFEDGPKPTGLRYCINSASLKLSPED